MPTPVQTLILDEIGLRLANISVANGYSSTPNVIKRASVEPFKGDDLPAINYWPGADTLLNKGHGWVERELTVAIEIYDRTRDEVFSDIAFELATDVAIALLRATTAPTVAAAPELTLGGLVRSSQLQSVTPQIGQGQTPWCGAALSYQLVYRVSASNPSTIVS